MSTWQERIVQCRFSNSVPHRCAGFLAKAGVEGGAVVGIPVAGFVFGILRILEVSVSELLPLRVQIEEPEITAWFLLTTVGWLRLRCFLTDRIPSE